jgi:hypothetical protein
MNPIHDLNRPTDRPALMRPGGLALCLGLLFLAMTIALSHVVMGAFLAVIPASMALPRLGIALLRTCDRAASWDRQLRGALLLLLAMGMLVVVTVHSCAIAYHLGLHQARPTFLAPSMEGWFTIAATWLLPAVFAYPGCSLWASWSGCRLSFWCAGAFATPAAAVQIQQTLPKLGFAPTA